VKKIVKSSNIYFRDIEYDDIDRGWLDWINDAELNKYLEYKKKTTKKDLIDYLNISQPPDVYMFAVCLEKNNKYIGNARLSAIDLKNSCASYGRLIGAKNLRGQGIGTEVLTLLAYYAFYNLNLHRIESGVISSNIASIRSNEKAGAIREGVLREASYINGEYKDIIMFGMLKPEFESISYSK